MMRKTRCKRPAARVDVRFTQAKPNERSSTDVSKGQVNFGGEAICMIMFIDEHA